MFGDTKRICTKSWKNKNESSGKTKKQSTRGEEEEEEEGEDDEEERLKFVSLSSFCPSETLQGRATVLSPRDVSQRIKYSSDKHVKHRGVIDAAAVHI